MTGDRPASHPWRVLVIDDEPFARRVGQAATCGALDLPVKPADRERILTSTPDAAGKRALDPLLAEQGPPRTGGRRTGRASLPGRMR